MSLLPPSRFNLTKKQQQALLAIDERLGDRLDLIADAIDRFQDQSEEARRARYADIATQGDLRDWNGEIMSDLGNKAQFSVVAQSAQALIDSLRGFSPFQQEQFSVHLGAYGHPQITSQTPHDNFHPDLRNYLVILARIAREGEDLAPDKKAGQPQRYTNLVESLILTCGVVGLFSHDDDVPTGSKGIIGRLLSLCLEIAGVPDQDQPDHGKAIRNALNYIDAQEAEGSREYAAWQESVRKNRDD